MMTCKLYYKCYYSFFTITLSLMLSSFAVFAEEEDPEFQAPSTYSTTRADASFDSPVLRNPDARNVDERVMLLRYAVEEEDLQNVLTNLGGTIYKNGQKVPRFVTDNRSFGGAFRNLILVIFNMNRSTTNYTVHPPLANGDRTNRMFIAAYAINQGRLVKTDDGLQHPTELMFMANYSDVAETNNEFLQGDAYTQAKITHQFTTNDGMATVNVEGVGEDGFTLKAELSNVPINDSAIQDQDPSDQLNLVQKFPGARLFRFITDLSSLPTYVGITGDRIRLPGMTAEITPSDVIEITGGGPLRIIGSFGGTPFSLDLLRESVFKRVFEKERKHKHKRKYKRGHKHKHKHKNKHNYHQW